MEFKNGKFIFTYPLHREIFGCNDIQLNITYIDEDGQNRPYSVGVIRNAQDYPGGGFAYEIHFDSAGICSDAAFMTKFLDYLASEQIVKDLDEVIRSQDKINVRELNLPGMFDSWQQGQGTSLRLGFGYYMPSVPYVKGMNYEDLKPFIEVAKKYEETMSELKRNTMKKLADSNTEPKS